MAVTPVLPSRIISKTTTAFTLDAFAMNATIVATNAGAITVTIPLESVVAYPVGTQIQIIEGGAGTVTVVKTGTDTLVGANFATALIGQTLFLTKLSSTAGVSAWSICRAI